MNQDPGSIGSSLFNSVKFNGTFKPDVTPSILNTTCELSRTDAVVNDKEA